MYERIRKYYCKKIMEADDTEAANIILSFLHAEDEGCLTRPVSSEDKENLMDWNEDLEGRY